jgi:hypothetical protein
MNANSSGYSTHVALFLVVNGREIELGQVGPQHCVVRHAEAFPPSQGEIVMIVDGNESRVPVSLPSGASLGSRRVPYTQLSASAVTSIHVSATR